MGPERVRLRQLFFCALFLSGFLLLFTQIKTTANLYDEGLVLTNAERVRAGELPYRDFWTMYGPGYFYALAGLFLLVEPTILAARLFDTVLRFLLTLKVYLLARTVTSSWVALIPYAFVTFWLATIRFYSYPAFPATGALLLAALAFTGYLRDRRGRWLFLSGMALGLTALLRLDFGGYGAFGFAVALALLELRESSILRDAWRVRLGRLLKVELLTAAGALLVALPLYGYLLVASGWATVYDVLIVFPATVFPAFRRLPVPPLFADFGQLSGLQWNDWLRLYIPLGIYAVAIVVSLRWLRLGRLSASDRRPAIAVLLLALTGTGLGLVVKATSRYHDLHVLPTTICASIVATALLYRIPRNVWRNTPFQVGFAGLAFLFLTGPYVAHFHMLTVYGPTSPRLCYSQLPRAGCVLVNHDVERVAQYLQANTRVNEYVFVGNSRHDLIFVNDLLIHFLADRPSPTRYTELHPGLATTLPVQEAIANELAEKDVQWVVIMHGWESQEPNASSISSGVTFLDDYLRERYMPDTTFESYQVWRRAP